MRLFGWLQEFGFFVLSAIFTWIRVLELHRGQPLESDELEAWSKAQRLQRRVRQQDDVTLPVLCVFSSSRRVTVPEVGPLETLSPGSRRQGYAHWQQPLDDLRPFVLWLKTRVLEAQQLGQPPTDLRAVPAAVRSAFQVVAFPGLDHKADDDDDSRSTDRRPGIAHSAEAEATCGGDRGGGVMPTIDNGPRRTPTARVVDLRRLGCCVRFSKSGEAVTPFSPRPFFGGRGEPDIRSANL